MAQWIRRPPTEWEILSSSLSRCISPYRLTVRTLSLHGRDWSSILHMDTKKIDYNFVIHQSKKTCCITMKIAEHQTLCPLCEDKIEVGDNIEYCHVRREWHHFVCPWTNDEGYRPDMVIIDADDDDEIISIMDHEKNKKKDRCLRVINEEQTSGEESQEYDDPISWKEIHKEGSWFEKLWKSVSDFFQF